MIKKFQERIISAEELLPEGTEILNFTIPGRPATKKTHQNVVMIKGYPRVLPSKQYVKYEKSCKQICENAWKNLGKIPMDFGIGINMRIILNNWAIGDHTGYCQAIGDILEKWGIIADDKWIHWVSDNQHWLIIDPLNPRIDIIIYRHKHPYEDYRKDKEDKARAAESRRQLKNSKASNA